MAKRSRESSFSQSSDDPTHSVEYSSASPAIESLPTKYTSLDTTTSGHAPEVMRCSLPPHRETLSFTSYGAYEVHYGKVHTNRCAECARNFPTEHFLSLHIEENHNPLREALKERGDKTYGCFVEDCERKCSTPQKRRLHLIDKHMFPRTYDFYIVNDGIDKHSSMLRPGHTHRRRISTANDDSRSTGRSRRISQLADTDPGMPREPEMISSMVEHESSDEEAEVPGPAKDAHSPEVRGQQLTINLKNSRGDASTMSDPMSRLTSPAGDGTTELERSMSALQFIPTSVTLNNRGKKKV